MSANIDSYIGRESAWHDVGIVTGHFMTWNEILTNGGLDFDVFKHRLFDMYGRELEAWGTFRLDRKYQGDMAKAIFFGPVGENYHVIDHRKGFELVDSMVCSVDGAHYETAGSLGKGEVVWGLADIGLDTNIGGDLHKNYLLFFTSHDGSMTTTYKLTKVRVVCQNTLNMALREKTANVFKIKHTKNSQQKLQSAHDALIAVREDIQDIDLKLKFLVTRKVTRETLNNVMDRVFPKTEKEDGILKSSTRRDNIIKDILELYEKNDNNAFPEQRGTAYNLLNAFTEHTDHFRSTKGDNRSNSALFGSGDKLKTVAFETIIQAANGMPVKQVAVSVEQSGSLLDAVIANS